MSAPVRAALAAFLLFASAPAWPQGDVAALVNGETITVQDWISRMRNLRGQSFVQSTNPVRFKNETAGQIALEELVSIRLLLQYAAKTSLQPTDAEVDAGTQNAKQQPAIADMLARKVLTEDQVRQDVKVQLTLYNVATINNQVSPEEVRAFYDKHSEVFGRPERWQLAVIRVASQQAVDKVQAELKKGTPFATVAAHNSDDPAAKQTGGDLGFVAPTDTRLPEAIREAVKKLKLGEVTPPLATAPAPGSTGRSFVFVRLIGKQEAAMQPFDRVQAQAERMALLEKAGGTAAAERKVDEFRKTSAVEVKLPGYEALFAKP
jgi:parvulin-like peptidyl-prolyl isomerase